MTLIKKKSFGKNLDSILSLTNNINEPISSLTKIQLTEIIPGRFQPRRNFDETSLNELASSIKEKGILQPVIVRKNENKYELIAGERRWRASEIAGLSEVPAIISNLDDESAMAFGVIENLQREDLSAIEEALALKKLTDDFSMTHEEVARVIGKSRVYVTNTLRLLSLNVEVKKLLEEKKLEAGHARCLLGLDEGEQIRFANKIVQQNLSVRRVEELVYAEKNLIDSIIFDQTQITNLEKEFEKILLQKVKIKMKSTGKGEIKIYTNSIHNIENLINHLKHLVRID